MRFWPVIRLIRPEGTVKKRFAGTTSVLARFCPGNIFSWAVVDIRCGLRRALARFPEAAILAAAVVLAAPFAASAQSTVPARVTDRVNNSQLVTLKGNTHPLARAQYDQGAAPADLPMNRIMLVLKRSADQESALQDLLEQQQVTSSPNFHKWLTLDQFGQQFGPADADIQAVTSWLASFGFQSIKVSRGRTAIEFSGTAAQVQTALHTPIHRYVVNGESHWANANDPQIPAAIAPVISGFASLHNFPKKPASVRSGRTAAFTRTPGGKPQINFQGGSHGVAPADFDTIYNINPATMTGSGVTIAVIARSNINLADVQEFRSLFGLPANDPQIKVNGPDPGDLGGNEEAEAVLDATWTGAVAPNATVDLVVSEATNAAAGEDLSEFYIIDNNLADVMTESFSVCEAGFGTQLSSAAAFYSSMAEQAAAQGITYLVASGDSGPDSCDDPSTVPTTPSAASVNLLASTPFTVAVGGTQFNDTASPSTYWNSTNDPTTLGSAKTYIPENVWNESCTVAQCGSSLTGLWSSGGGQSIAFNKPPWQTGVVGIPSANARFVPDVSVTSADHDGYVLCLDASCQGSNPGFSILSGTSASAQAFGGIMALVVQKTGRVGIANYTLYKLAAAEPPTTPGTNSALCNGSSTTTLPANTCIFNDVIVGNTNIPVNPSEGFAAGVGYDEATGLGSVNVSNLVNQWHTAIVQGSTTTLSLSTSPATNPITLTHGQPVNVNITVAAQTSGAGTPSGDVSLIAATNVGRGADAFTLASNGSIPPGSTTTLLPGSPVPGGSYNVTAHYEGDATFLPSDSTPVSVIVNPESSLTTLSIVTPTNNNATSIVYGSSYMLAVQIANLAGTLCNPNGVGGPACPTGTVNLTDNGNPLDGVNGNFSLNSEGEFEDQTIQLPAGIHNIKAAYAGDGSFKGSTSGTDVVTVSKATTTTSLAANPTTAAAGANVTLTATVAAPQSNAIANTSQEPTGTVQFFLNGAAFGSPVTVTGVLNSNVTFAESTASLSTTTLANGQSVITAQYSGDTNYVASSTTAPVTVTVGSTGINVTPGCGSSTISITAPGQSGSCVITVTGANGFAGSIALSAAVSSTPPSAVDVPACTFGAPDQNFTAPNTITLSASSETGSATMTCSSTAAAGILIRPSHPSSRVWPLAGVATCLASIFFLFIVPQQRRWRMIPLAVLLVVIAAAGISCSGGGSGIGGGTNAGTTTGAYTFKVSATPSTGSAQSTTVTVNVQ